MTKLKQRREEQALTQVQVASEVGITERCYQRYEAGQRIPNVKIAQKLASVLNTTVENLFSNTL